MSTPGTPDAGDILRSLRLLRSPEPADRQDGIAILVGLVDDWRVQQVFEYLHGHDPDLGVRAAAWLALNRQLPPHPTAQPESSVALAASTQPTPTSAMGEPGKGQGLFLLNPANALVIARETRRQADRKAQVRREKRLVLWLAGGLLVIASVLWGMVLPGWFTWYQLEQSGVTTQGEVTALQARRVPGGDTHYYVLYRFRVGLIGVDEAVYNGEQRIEPAVFDRMAEDTPVAVTYLPNNPNTSRLDQPDPAERDHLRLTVGAALLTFSLPLLAIWRRLRTRRLVKMERHKRLIRGEVVVCQGHLDRDGDFTLKLRYRFTAPNGQMLGGQAVQLRNDLKANDLPAPGTPVTIYYHGPTSHYVL